MATSSVKRLVMTALLVALPAVVSAQDATITGTVTDTTGGVLPGVSITVVNEASGITFEGVPTSAACSACPPASATIG